MGLINPNTTPSAFEETPVERVEEKVKEAVEVIEKALRFNDGKPQWHLVDFDSLLPLVRVLEFGAGKYGAFNWQKKTDKHTIIDSMLRHAFALNKGEELDKESGLHHIGHILSNCLFYSYHFAEKK